jgi:hypothetical protein
MGEVLHYRLGKFEGHACNGADFGRFLSVASVAQLAEQLTLNLNRHFPPFRHTQTHRINIEDS